MAGAVESAQAACLKADTDDQTAQGRLLRRKFIDEAYKRTEYAFILQLRAPACLEGEGEYDKVDSSPRIHVFSMDERIRRKLRSLVGRNVVVRGNPFGEHTAHHHAPIVMQIVSVNVQS